MTSKQHEKAAPKDLPDEQVEAGAIALCEIDNPGRKWPEDFREWRVDDYRARAAAVLNAAANAQPAHKAKA